MAGINFDFTTGSLPAGITFARASIGTYTNNAGTLITATNDVARFNYVGGVSNLLIEPSATNLLPYSNGFDQGSAWGVIGGSLAASQFTAPDGTNNGWSLTTTAASTARLQTGPFTFSAIPYTISIWAKFITGTSAVQMVIDGSALSAALVTSATLARLSYTVTTAAGSDASKIYTTDPVAGRVNGYFGAQLESGSAPTSYIPTTTAAVTRQADSATFTIPAGINQLVYTFDDNSTQTVAVSPGSYTIPTTLNRPNIKSIAGRYAFDFTSGSLPAGMTFTRPSIGTYVNNAGTLITAGNDVARFNYVSGVANLLIEGSATNLLLQSNNFSVIWGTNAAPVLTAAQFISPDATNNGWSMTSGTGTGSIYQLFTLSNVPYVVSVWAKLITGTAPIKFLISGTNAGTYAITATLTRIFGTATPPAVSDATYILVNAASGSTNGIYGAQLELGSAPTSYIPTTTASVTRAADSAVFTIPSGVAQLTYTFDDNTTQTVPVTAGSYTIPVTLARANIKSIAGVAPTGTPVVSPYTLLSFQSLTLVANTPVQVVPPGAGHYVICFLNTIGGKFFISDKNTVGANLTSYTLPDGVYSPNLPMANPLWVASDTTGTISVYVRAAR